ncbi:MAG: hypothetical protein D3913_09525, partial [Candidatus Electrothrix sp. LOE1_4_5]|nr:hypothetical protein [Candidatus Electrothrix gigas]
MLTWIKKNKDWLFSGVAIAILVPLISHFWPSGGEQPPPQPDTRIEQNNTGPAYAAKGNQTITHDNSVRQSHIVATNVAGRDLIKIYS